MTARDATRRSIANCPPAGDAARTLVTHFNPGADRIILPDVRCDLVWVEERLWLLGPMSRGRPSAHVGKHIALISFDPLVARAWLGAPLVEFTDRALLLEDVIPEPAKRLAEGFHKGDAERLARGVGMSRLPQGRRAGRAEAILRAGQTVRMAADAAELSDRHLARLFYDGFGLSPKVYARVLRLRRAMEMVSGGEALAVAAVASGYVDQAHFNREARALTGQTPRTLAPRVGNIQDLREAGG